MIWFEEEYMKYYNTKVYSEIINDFADYIRQRGRNNNHKDEKPIIIYTPPKKPIEEQRLRPKFRRKKLGEITIWIKGNIQSNTFKSVYSDSLNIRIEIEGEEGFGEVPESIIKKLKNNVIVVEGINVNIGIWYPKVMNKRRFLYECLVHSQYVEFEECYGKTNDI